MITGLARPAGPGLGRYLSREERVEGRWLGLACERYGVVAGERVAVRDFEALESNRHPVTGKRVTARQNTTRVEHYVNGEGLLEEREVSNRTGVHHFMFGCPKTGSVACLAGGDERWRSWHSRAVHAALGEMEKLTRVQRGGETGRFCAAVFEHELNGAGEPHLHTHAAVFNATPAGGRDLAVDGNAWYGRFAYLTAVYRSSLAASMAAAGLEVELDRFGAPQVKGLTDVAAAFNERSEQIRALVTLAETAVGAKLKPEEAKRLVAASSGFDLNKFKERLETNRAWFEERKRLEGVEAEKGALRRELLKAVETLCWEASNGEKPAGATPERVTEWKTKLTPEQVERLGRARQSVPVVRGPVSPREPECLERSIRHCFQNRSVAEGHELLTEALNAGMGEPLSLDALKKLLAGCPQLIATREGAYTTPGHLARELDLVRWVERGKGQGLSFERVPDDGYLNPNQRDVINSLLANRDQFQVMRGGAGVGKSHSLKPLVNRNVEAGRKVFVMAPSNAARDTLRDEGGQAFVEAESVSMFLASPSLSGKVRAGDLILADEAGMLSGKQMHDLFHLARVRGARVLLVGDPRQHVSVEAGDALRLLLRRSTVHAEHLYRIVRQDPQAMGGMYLRSAKLFARGLTTKAFAQLDRAGGIVERQGEDRVNAMADAWMAERAAGRSAVAVNPTHRENDRVNAAVRLRRIALGQLTDEREVASYRSLGWTPAQRAQTERIALGFILEITRGTGKGDAYVAVEHGPKGVKGECGKKARWFTAKQAETFDVCAPQTLKVAIGDELLTRAGVKTRAGEVINGERVTVTGFTADGTVKGHGGKLITTKNLCHAYAVTSHRAQSGTWDTALVGLDETSAGFATQKQALVAASRGRTRIRVFVSNKALLTGVEQRSGDRRAASDVTAVRAAGEAGDRRRMLDELDRLQRRTRSQAYPGSKAS